MEDENNFNSTGMSGIPRDTAGSGTTEEAWQVVRGKEDTVIANESEAEQMSHLYPCGEGKLSGV
ncbi:hypothetical protein QA612_19665 [Evansella sp. AB-P1]|uniref:hypothetical protein n=1 Tax=Evansella sp. AB-P1 TaxID=3037653 RepID=UPI00241CDBC3|nr:hypothetical protein [Evansella sp. AB-P1]MDG5789678.1 hypothetical protein [Evansella sp. AB-P1]